MLAPNSIEGKAAGYLERIENLLAALESERGKYMAACKPIREDIADIYTEAKDQGVAKKALAGLVKYRELEKRQQAIGDGLDIADQSDYESLVAALGDFGKTELGKAVLETAKAKEQRDAKPGKPPSKALKKAIKGLGTPVPLTEQEKADGVTAAFEGKDGTRLSIAMGDTEPPDADAVAARTAEDMAEPIDEIDKPFSERHAGQKAQDAAAFEAPPAFN
jgi:uncharacterized protein (UPF0335 family)